MAKTTTAKQRKRPSALLVKSKCGKVYRAATPLPADVPRRELHSELETRALLGAISRKFIRKLVAQGALTPLTLGDAVRPIFYARSEIDRLLKSARMMARARRVPPLRSSASPGPSV